MGDPERDDTKNLALIDEKGGRGAIITYIRAYRAPCTIVGNLTTRATFMTP